MKVRSRILDRTLRKAEFGWKGLRFFKGTLLLGTAVALLVFLLGAAVVQKWVGSRQVFITLLAALASLSFLAWLLMLIRVAASHPDRGWLASIIERANRLQDRLNALVFLETSNEPQSRSFARHIGRQVQPMVQDPHYRAKPFYTRSTAGLALLFLAALAATTWFYDRYSPLARLNQKEARQPAEHAPRPPLNIPAPDAIDPEQKVAWGEIRITDPGQDLKLTKVDVLPLQIEAAADQPLQHVQWATAVNGSAETARDLGRPTNSSYAVFQPVLYLDELRLADWDVLTYYASAVAKGGSGASNVYGSEVYFVEVRPFREDILKMPGGESGAPYQRISEISSLIQRQQNVIRQTHHHLQRPLPEQRLQAQDRVKLADAETEISTATRHLYAGMAAELEDGPIADTLDNLAKAEHSLKDASRHLLANSMVQAQTHERSALAELIAARKVFQKAVSDNPENFDKGNTEDAPPVADQPDKLNQMAEFRNESKAAQDFLAKTLEQQKGLEQRVRSMPRGAQSTLAEQQRQLQKALSDFQAQHPQPFKGSGSQSQAANQAMTNAAESLQNQKPDSLKAAQNATHTLQQLQNAVENQTNNRQLADAYRLKQLLDEQAEKLNQAAQANSPQNAQELKNTADRSRDTVQQLQSLAEQQPTRDAFGQPLRDALSGTNKAALDSALQQLAAATPPEAATQSNRAAQARDELQKLSQAFEKSQPDALKLARQKDALKPDAKNSFNQGMAELDSMVQQMEKDSAPPAQDQMKQGRQALSNLQTGMRSLYGDNEAGNRLLARLDQMLQTQALEVGDLKKLLDQLHRFSVENAEKLSREKEKAELANVDPDRLAPTYRDRIQKYFQRLSER